MYIYTHNIYIYVYVYIYIHSWENISTLKNMVSTRNFLSPMGIVGVYCFFWGVCVCVKISVYTLWLLRMVLQGHFSKPLKGWSSNSSMESKNKITNHQRIYPKNQEGPSNKKGFKDVYSCIAGVSKHLQTTSFFEIPWFPWFFTVVTSLNHFILKPHFWGLKTLKIMPPRNCWGNKSLLEFNGLFGKTIEYQWSKWTPRVQVESLPHQAASKPPPVTLKHAGKNPASRKGPRTYLVKRCSLPYQSLMAARIRSWNDDFSSRLGMLPWSATNKSQENDMETPPKTNMGPLENPMVGRWWKMYIYLETPCASKFSCHSGKTRFFWIAAWFRNCGVFPQKAFSRVNKGIQG